MAPGANGCGIHGVMDRRNNMAPAIGVPALALAATIALAALLVPGAPSAHRLQDRSGAASQRRAALDSTGPGVEALPADLPDPDSGAERLDRPAPEFAFSRWARGGPLRIADLRGKVVLVRFWTDQCRFCRTTLPALEHLRGEHARDGLVVIGAYHPHRPGLRRSDAEVLRSARRLGFDGPIAVDQNWGTLERWWLRGHPDRNWLSASFLIDREGVVRWVQGGGEYHPAGDPSHARCEVEYRGLEKRLATLLAEPAP